MVFNVVNIKICNPLELYSDLIDKKSVLYHYSYT